MKNVSSKRLGSVKMMVDGLKGLEVSYETIDVQKEESFRNEHNDKRHRPVHKELKVALTGLKEYFADLCGYLMYVPGEFRESMLSLVEVTGVKAGGDKFCITGKVRCFDDKIIGMATPTISVTDGYDHYDDVMKLVDVVYKEADLYMKGDRLAAKNDIIVDYMRIQKKQNGFEIGDYTNMPLEEQEKLMKEIQKDLCIKMTLDEDGGDVAVPVMQDVPATDDPAANDDEDIQF